MNIDLRDSDEYGSQRMLNAIESGSALPIHRASEDIRNDGVPEGEGFERSIMTSWNVFVQNRSYWSLMESMWR